MSDLRSEHSAPVSSGTAPLNGAPLQSLVKQIPLWRMDSGGKVIERTFQFKNYYETMAFVNAVAWIAHRQDHHPDLEVQYNRCQVRFSTHKIGGLSRNDFICAAHVDALSE